MDEKVRVYIINHSRKEYDLIEDKYYDKVVRLKEQLSSKGIIFDYVESMDSSIEDELKNKGYNDVHWTSWGIL